MVQHKFDDIPSSPSLDAARKNIDNMEKENKLYLTLMLNITKTWAVSKRGKDEHWNGRWALQTQSELMVN